MSSVLNVEHQHNLNINFAVAIITPQAQTSITARTGSPLGFFSHLVDHIFLWQKNTQKTLKKAINYKMAS